MGKTGKKAEARKSKPTSADLGAAGRLSAIWKRLEGHKDRPSQEKIGAMFIPEISQGAVSQYIKGDIALNFQAVLVFAHALNVRPCDIRDDLTEFVLLKRIGWGPPEIESKKSADIATFPRGDWPFSPRLKARFDALPPEHRPLLEMAFDNSLRLVEASSPSMIGKSKKGKNNLS